MSGARRNPRDKTRFKTVTKNRRVKERDHVCERKVRHACEASARIAAQRHIGQHDVAIPRLWVYHCPTCRGWHLTSRERQEASITVAEVFAEDTL